LLSLSKQLLVLSLVSFAVLYCYTTFQSSVSSDVQDATASPAASSATSFAGLAGLAISVFLSMTQSLNWTVRMASEIESQMVAVERVCNYANTVQEKPHYKHADPPAIGKGSSDSVGSNTLTISDSEGEDVTNALHDPSSNFPLSNRAVALQANAWSSRGEVNFDRVTLQYRGDTPAVFVN
jgi:ABC-type multidrug transport system fused ATPase/permease subunit